MNTAGEGGGVHYRPSIEWHSYAAVCLTAQESCIRIPYILEGNTFMLTFIFYLLYMKYTRDGSVLLLHSI